MQRHLTLEQELSVDLFKIPPFTLSDGDILTIVGFYDNDRELYCSLIKEFFRKTKSESDVDFIDWPESLYRIGFGEPKIKWEGSQLKFRNWTLLKYLTNWHNVDKSISDSICSVLGVDPRQNVIHLKRSSRQMICLLLILLNKKIAVFCSQRIGSVSELENFYLAMGRFVCLFGNHHILIDFVSTDGPKGLAIDVYRNGIVSMPSARDRAIGKWNSEFGRTFDGILRPEKLGL